MKFKKTAKEEVKVKAPKEKTYTFKQSEYDAWDKGGNHTGIVKHFTKFLEETQK